MLQQPLHRIPSQSLEHQDRHNHHHHLHHHHHRPHHRQEQEESLSLHGEQEELHRQLVDQGEEKKEARGQTDKPLPQISIERCT